MTQDCRLSEGGRIDRARPVTFTFNGKRYRGFHGDTIASALLANGVHFVGRSWKYHRPRGIVTAGVEEPNAIVQLERGAHTVPNARATEVEIYEGLTAESVNAQPSIELDRRALFQKLGRFIPAGFYYKTFMWPKRLWPFYEKLIRDTAGFGEAPDRPDPDRYEKTYAHCDVLIVGAGPAGLAAAHSAAATGARIMLIDDQPYPGGSLLGQSLTIDGQPAAAWIARIVDGLRALPEVTILSRTTVFGYHDHNLLTACQRMTDHLPLSQRRGPRERLWKIRARRVVLATGAHERPLVFGGNDLPGVMLASAVSTYIHRYGVLSGRRAIVFTNNDSAYRCALDLKRFGTEVTVVDARRSGDGTLPRAARDAGIEIVNEAAVTKTEGKYRVRSATVASYRGGALGSQIAEYECDLIAMSGGWNPALHLFAQSGGSARWDEEKACFVPDAAKQAAVCAGAVTGEWRLDAVLRQGALAGRDAAALVGCSAEKLPVWQTAQQLDDPLTPLWLVAERAAIARGPKRFVDFQNDVTAADVHLAAREGYDSVEHMKRYTALGLGTDQGKLGNITGLAIFADALGQSIPETGTTTFRPNYTPVTIGAFAGRELGDFLDPIRKTCIHEWHVDRGAVFEDVGTWKRPLFYPRAGEDLHAAVGRECQAVRNTAGILDASTLGKIDVQGPDAVELLEWMYTNSWGNLAIGKCRYGLMLDENGMVFDDGVTTRIAENHFLVSTTTGGAARVLNWMERWLQTEWPQLKVYLTSVTDHFATFAVAGPNSQRVLQSVCDNVDFSNAAFPFMSMREGSVAGVQARIMRISFSGELSYEVNVPANSGRAVWDALVVAGEPHGITPYGTEAMHVLRAEKGYIIVGQDTDGSVTPHDLGMHALATKSRDFLGKRSLTRADTAAGNRKQFVGLLASDSAFVLPEGAQLVDSADRSGISIGHVTSSYMSPTLGRSIALGLVQSGRDRIGQDVAIAVASGKQMTAKICSPVFYDAEGARQRVD